MALKKRRTVNKAKGKLVKKIIKVAATPKKHITTVKTTITNKYIVVKNKKDDTSVKEEPTCKAGGWVNLPPSAIFKATSDPKHHSSGECLNRKGLLDWKFMKAPYVKKSEKSIKLTVTDDIVKKRACIFQNSYDTCRFFAGAKGIEQLEFDYEITGDIKNNFMAFWLDANDGKYVGGGSFNPLESDQFKYQLAHNFGGPGKRATFDKKLIKSGHVTTWMTNKQVQMKACENGSETCERRGNLATLDLKPVTWKIDQGKMLHHFVVDYWVSAGKGSMKISNIRAKVGCHFYKTCKAVENI